MKDFKVEKVNEYTSVVYYDNGKSLTIVDKDLRDKIKNRKKRYIKHSLIKFLSIISLILGLILMINSILGYTDDTEILSIIEEKWYVSIYVGSLASIVVSAIILFGIRIQKMEEV